MDDWIFDMDGVLVNSEKYVARAAVLGINEYINMLVQNDRILRVVTVNEDDFKPYVGMGDVRYLQGVCEKHNIPVSMERGIAISPELNMYDLQEIVYHHYEKIIVNEDILVAGVPDFLYEVKNAGGKIAIATGADERRMKINLRRMGFAEESLDAYVAGNDPELTAGKPNPQIFLLAARRLESHPSKCIVAEDSDNGIIGALDGKFRCLALTTTYTREQLVDKLLGREPNWYVPNFLEVPEQIRPAA